MKPSDDERLCCCISRMPQAIFNHYCYWNNDALRYLTGWNIAFQKIVQELSFWLPGKDMPNIPLYKSITLQAVLLLLSRCWLIHKERRLMNGQFCPETHPELTTLKNMLVISTDNRADKLQLRMTWNKRWKPHPSRNLSRAKNGICAVTWKSVSVHTCGWKKTAKRRVFFSFQMTLLVYTPQSVLTEWTPCEASAGFCQEGCYIVVGL